MAVQIPRTMKAAIVETFQKPLTFKEIPVPTPKADEVLMHITVSGVCHTDVHVQEGDWPVQAPLPCIPGHEGVGKVVKVGANVTDLKVGDRVCSPWLGSACRDCGFCIDGWESLCEKQKNTGFTIDGAYAQYAALPAPWLGRIPDGLSDEQAAPICCAGVTVYKAIKVANLKSGQWVTIIGGGGGLGHLAVQYAKYFGLKVIGIDVGRNDFMLKLGCDAVIDARKENVIDRVCEIIPGGSHGVINVAPSIQALQAAVKYVRRNGVLVLVALPAGAFPVEPFDAILKGIKIIGSIVGTRSDLAEAMAIAAEKKVTCQIQMRNFDEVNDILDELRAGKYFGRVVMRM